MAFEYGIQPKYTVDGLLHFLKELTPIVDEGLLPDKTRISLTTKKLLKAKCAAALSICRDARSIPYDVRLKSIALCKSLGDIGFLGEEAHEGE